MINLCLKCSVVRETLKSARATVWIVRLWGLPKGRKEEEWGDLLFSSVCRRQFISATATSHSHITGQFNDETLVQTNRGKAYSSCFYVIIHSFAATVQTLLYELSVCFKLINWWTCLLVKVHWLHFGVRALTILPSERVKTNQRCFLRVSR